MEAVFLPMWYWDLIHHGRPNIHKCFLKEFGLLGKRVNGLVPLLL